MKPPRTSLPLCTVLVPFEERRRVPRIFTRITGCANAKPVTLFGKTYEPGTLRVSNVDAKPVRKLGVIRVRVRVGPAPEPMRIQDVDGTTFTVDEVFERIDFDAIGKL